MVPVPTFWSRLIHILVQIWWTRVLGAVEADIAKQLFRTQTWELQYSALYRRPLAGTGDENCMAFTALMLCKLRAAPIFKKLEL